jgi:hypothetical protein
MKLNPPLHFGLAKACRCEEADLTPGGRNDSYAELS